MRCDVSERNYTFSYEICKDTNVWHGIRENVQEYRDEKRERKGERQMR